ncbi:cytochrome b5 domain-containing 1 [Catenaria anguillulae PL171]|uniref:Cytochrome b5 domain-containing protein 1 n=1 Tax=Catenaria anguillulae PL171 TaxID=765915 RepID=A0A1Y2HB90_9FUNG|nr:cytochrome b5 domain-containing 1 [Catenaria anguillulae PL171]
MPGATDPTPTAQQSRFFTPAEVALHHQRGDIWVSWLGHVYNLTALVDEYYGDSRLLPIIQNAGKDISHWFDPTTGDLQLCTDPRTGLRVPKCPDGIPVHVPHVTQPSATLAWEVETPWWLDARKYQDVNTLIGDETVLEICTEEPIQAIVDRYVKHNAHAKGYVWKYLGRVLDMSATFAENGIANESEDMERIGINELDWLPALFLYFADDLTVA